MNGQTLQKGLVGLPGGGQAVYNASGLLYYGHSDHLGSVKLGSTTSRTISFDLAYAPYGETYATSGSTDFAFTGQRQDTVAGVFDFPARQYSNLGRWPNPDPSGLASVSLHDPQTFNRYAYVRNNPLAMIDPNGLCGGDEDLIDDYDGNVCSDAGGGSGGAQSPTTGGDQNNSGGNCGSDDPACMGNSQPGFVNPANNPLAIPSPGPPPPPPGVITVSLKGNNPLLSSVPDPIVPGAVVSAMLETDQPLSSGVATVTVTLSASGTQAAQGTIGLTLGKGDSCLLTPTGSCAQGGQTWGLLANVPTGSNNGSFGFSNGTTSAVLAFTITDAQGNFFAGAIRIPVATGAGQTNTTCTNSNNPSSCAPLLPGANESGSGAQNTYPVP